MHDRLRESDAIELGLVDVSHTGRSTSEDDTVPQRDSDDGL